MSTGATVAIAAVAVLPIAMFGAMLLLPWYAMRQAEPALVLVTIVSLAGLWPVLGFELLRGYAHPARVSAAQT